MAGYRQGRVIVERFMRMMESDDKTPFASRLGTYLTQEDDPRLAEIMERLKHIASQRGAP